jgi:glucan phosphoethanolaminetransferase (alkaline phosphatase superfamily)
MSEDVSLSFGFFRAMIFLLLAISTMVLLGLLPPVSLLLILVMLIMLLASVDKSVVERTVFGYLMRKIYIFFRENYLIGDGMSQAQIQKQEVKEEEEKRKRKKKTPAEEEEEKISEEKHEESIWGIKSPR